MTKLKSFYELGVGTAHDITYVKFKASIYEAQEYSLMNVRRIAAHKRYTRAFRTIQI